MKNFLKKDWFWHLVYLLIALVGIWFLTKLWIPVGYVIAGHDSGLALNTSSFLKTRFFAWDERISFGVDNSPHFGSIILHSIDYFLSVLAGVPYAGSQLAVFFWISTIFIFAFIFSYSLKNKLGKYFVFLFPVFLTFNFFIFQSIFILERAKYELICVILLFLTLGLAVLFDRTKSVLRSSIIFAFIFSVFNGGSWLGLPLYGGLLITGAVYLLFATAVSFKEKDFGRLRRAFGLSLLSGIFFVLLNLYSIMPFMSTLISSDYVKVIDPGTIAAGEEWLNYISRGSSWINLFRFQGVPEWYLSNGLPNPDYSYAGIYLTNSILVLVSFLIPTLSLVGLVFLKKQTEKYLIWFFVVMLLVSMFFASGTKSSLDFLYLLLYERIPGFSIFRSPYYKFGSSYIIAFVALLAYSLSKLGEFLSSKIKTRPSVVSLLFVLAMTIAWFSYNFVIFNKDYIFKWQPDKSTLVKVPNYVNEFNSWLSDTEFDGRILMVPAFDGNSGNDSYTWGYWSLSPAPSVLSNKGDFIVNDVGNSPPESDWINKVYLLLLKKDSDFLYVSNKLGIRYVFLRNDFLPQDQKLQKRYLDAIEWLLKNNDLALVKSFGPWSIYLIKKPNEKVMFKLTNSIFSIPQDHIFLAKELITPNYRDGHWVDSEDIGNDLKGLGLKEFYPLNCNSCLVENLGRHADFSPVKILPNSFFYPIKKKFIEKNLLKSGDDGSKVGDYIGLVLIKLSEIRSMYELRVDELFIIEALRDMNGYLRNIEDIISKSESVKNNFYFASKIYETMNPLQRFFRDHISNSGFGFENPSAKDEVSTTLWRSISIKRLFDQLLINTDQLGYKKLFNLDLPEDGKYQLMIDAETLPNNGRGSHLYPSELVMRSNGDSFDIKTVEGSRWIFTDIVDLSKKDQLQMVFNDLPNLFQFRELTQVDFPQGARGCLAGKINYFNKNREYKFIISSESGISNMRFYIKENSSHNVSSNGFLQGDVEVDITLDPSGSAFTHIYPPSKGASEPQIYLCRYDGALPKNIKVSVFEIFSPSVYVVRDDAIKIESAKITYKKLNAASYKIATDDLADGKVMIFNQAFNRQWRLYDESKESSFSHFRIDGYANAWYLPGGRKYNLVLVYEPQTLFEKGTKVSILVAIMLLATYVLSRFREKNNEKK